MSTASLNHIPTGDADGDASNLNDLLHGGPLDPNEGTETDKQLVNVGGKGEDVRPLQVLHDVTDLISKLSFETKVSLAETAGALAAAALAATTIAGAGVGLFVASLQAIREQNAVIKDLQLQKTQADPFDPNYKQVFSPVFFPVETLPLLPSSVSAGIAANLQAHAKALLTAEENDSSYAQAVYVTQNRLFSAEQQSDLSGFDIQNTALGKYVAALAAGETTQAQAAAALEADLANAGANEQITTADVTSLQSDLKSQGFAALPAQEQTAIRNYFPSPADQQAIVNNLTQVDPNTVLLSRICSTRVEDGLTA